MLLAENAIQDIMTEQTPLPVTVDRIIDEVARTYGVTAEDIRGQRRSNQISTPGRWPCMWSGRSPA